MSTNPARALLPVDDIEESFSLTKSERRIVAAARERFAEIGVRKTRMEDVADRAGLSRQTIYKYFSNKQDIVDLLGRIEMLRVNRTVRTRVPTNADSPTKITEALIYCIQVARENVYLRKTIEDVSQMPRYSTTDAPYLWQREQWGHLLEEGQRKGELARDLPIDAIVHWLILAQFSLLFAVEKMPVQEIDLRAYVRRFFVEPLIARPTTDNSGDHSEKSRALEDENRRLREIVAQQALALHEHR